MYGQDCRLVTIVSGWARFWPLPSRGAARLLARPRPAHPPAQLARHVPVAPHAQHPQVRRVARPTLDERDQVVGLPSGQCPDPRVARARPVLHFERARVLAPPVGPDRRAAPRAQPIGSAPQPRAARVLVASCDLVAQYALVTTPIAPPLRDRGRAVAAKARAVRTDPPPDQLDVPAPHGTTPGATNSSRARRTTSPRATSRCT